MTVYIVQAINDFDDIVVGCYDNHEDACARCHEIVNDPELRYVSCNSFNSDTGMFLRCVVLKGEITGTEFEEVYAMAAAEE